jgi:ankyrin repeat protein
MLLHEPCPDCVLLLTAFVGAQGYTPLHVAALLNREDAVEHLLGKGAGVEAKSMVRSSAWLRPFCIRALIPWLSMSHALTYNTHVITRPSRTVLPSGSTIHFQQAVSNRSTFKPIHF